MRSVDGRAGIGEGNRGIIFYTTTRKCVRVSTYVLRGNRKGKEKREKRGKANRIKLGSLDIFALATHRPRESRERRFV